MSDEYAFKGLDGQWVSGFDTRESAISAGYKVVGSQVVTAKFEADCPSYFARFEARTILSRMIDGLHRGQEIGKVIDGASAADCLAKIEDASVGFPEQSSREYELQIDLMSRLQAAVAAWISENNIEFERPRFIAYMSEELHVAGAGLNIQVL